jgi:carbon storage regulator CsrA
MLVLSRRLNEKLLFPTLGVTIQVVSVQSGVVRLGIEAPPAVRVLREELLGRPCPAGARGPDNYGPALRFRKP